MIRKWDPRKGTATLVMQGHEGYVTGLQFYEYGLATSSGDKTIKMWDRITMLHTNITFTISVRTGECHRTLKGHSNTVSCLQVRELTFVY
jgi:division protein 1